MNPETKSRPRFAPGILFLAVLAAALLAACEPRAASRDASAKGAEGMEAAVTYYTCPMHPQIIRDKPGQCPICNMDLVPVEEDHEHAGEEGGGDASADPAEGGELPVVRVSSAASRTLGVRSETVARHPLAVELRLDGRVTPEEGKLYAVTARATGYAEIVHASATGQTVRKGDPLVELYAPDVVATLERLTAAGGSAEPPALIRQRLINWGVPEDFVRRAERKGRAERLFPVHSPVSGVVIRKEVLEGGGVMPGMELYRIADLSTVWVTARVWQRDLAWVRPGARAEIRFSNLPGRVFEAAVFFVSPELDPSTRTAEVRMRLANTPALDLRPEMLAAVTLRDTSAHPVLAVPAQALIRAGTRNVAVLDLGGGRFQPREVTTGREAGGLVEILKGIEEGENVVTSAQFFIDAESNLRAAVQRLREEGDSSAGPGTGAMGGGHVH